ncbi:succinyl-diaminopimelate desuccinylase [Methylobacterium phyllostachyos]|uniref:Probable succinyl-diaminopimelate desuccinylase n=1 Tax=Methylobacterium phyllostachyos TaxID=582672 RepID=A0A1H0AKE5_9HYPH|nr:M20 family metallopeptidase [Methylobacterium phyllostachyos]SDN33593.1 succinyl-diaminopimelate desuccinylase [Methylobacterium phyllostachyos]
MPLNGLDLAQQLIRFRSINPPGEEKACSEFIARLLTEHGFDVASYAFAKDRPTLVARIPGLAGGKPLCFTGHIDVVPLGSNEWRFPPFEGVVQDGRLYGRGASDMKAGVAAFIAAVCNLIEDGHSFRRGVTLVITAGEETGCEGAFHVGREKALGPAELLIVAEPTSNAPIFAHKGSLRVVVSARGRTAHSSMPHEGENAISKAAEWIRTLEGHDFGARHPLLGSATACVTTVRGGENINSVPDFAEFTIDIRTLPEQKHAALIAELSHLFGSEAEIRVVTSFPGFATDPDDPSAAPLLSLLRERTGAPAEPAGAPYFTDASALVPAFDGVATVVIGPGEAAQCHKTDEYCLVERIEEAQAIYRDLMLRMCCGHAE